MNKKSKNQSVINKSHENPNNMKKHQIQINNNQIINKKLNILFNIKVQARVRVIPKKAQQKIAPRNHPIQTKLRLKTLI